MYGNGKVTARPILLHITGMFPVEDTSCRIIAVCVCVCPPTYR